MLNVTTAVRNAIESQEAVVYLTMTINWPTGAGGTERLTDYHSDITITDAGGIARTYDADGGLLGYSRPSARSVISRNEFSIELENNSNTRNTQIAAAQSGVPITVHLNFENPETGAHIGQIEIYNGISTSAQITTGNIGQVLRIDFSGQLSNLGEIDGRFTTPASQQAIDSLDTSMDYAHNPDGDLILLWGRT